jgi:hypothetical protein
VILRLVEIETSGSVYRLRRPQTHLRRATRRGTQKPGLGGMVSFISFASASVFTEGGGV